MVEQSRARGSGLDYGVIEREFAEGRVSRLRIPGTNKLVMTNIIVEQRGVVAVVRASRPLVGHNTQAPFELQRISVRPRNGVEHQIQLVPQGKSEEGVHVYRFTGPNDRTIGFGFSEKLDLGLAIGLGVGVEDPLLEAAAIGAFIQPPVIEYIDSLLVPGPNAQARGIEAC